MAFDELDHVQTLVTYGSGYSLMEIVDFMSDMKISGDEKFVRGLKVIAKNPFSQYILDECRTMRLQKFPVSIRAIYQKPGTQILKCNVYSAVSLSFYHCAALAHAMRLMRRGTLRERNHTDENATTPPILPLDWTDSDWFCRMWDQIIPRAAAASRKLEKKVLNQDDATAIAASVYNHFVVHLCLRADTAKIRNTPAERLCNSTFYAFLSWCQSRS